MDSQFLMLPLPHHQRVIMVIIKADRSWFLECAQQLVDPNILVIAELYYIIINISTIPYPAVQSLGLFFCLLKLPQPIVAEAPWHDSVIPESVFHSAVKKALHMRGQNDIVRKLIKRQPEVKYEKQCYT